MQLPGPEFLEVGAAASVRKRHSYLPLMPSLHSTCGTSSRTGASVASLAFSVNDPLLPSRDIHLNKRLYTYLISKLGGAYFDVCIYSRLSSARCHLRIQIVLMKPMFYRNCKLV